MCVVGSAPNHWALCFCYPFIFILLILKKRYIRSILILKRGSWRLGIFGTTKIVEISQSGIPRM